MTTIDEAPQPAIADDQNIPPAIPDFHADAHVIATYDDARIAYESREANDAEERTRATFAQKRAAILAEIAEIAALHYERRMVAQQALWNYANQYPLRVVGDTPLRPSFWESVWSFGSAGRAFQRALVTAADVVQAQAQRRRLERSEAELEQQLQRVLYLQEEARKKSLETPEGLAPFHAQPDIAALRDRIEAIEAERALYAARLEMGLVSLPERRDRAFAEHKISQLEAPFDGVTIIRLARFGNLTYFIFRDLDAKLYALAYDVRLEPLIDRVIDVYWLADRFRVRLTCGPTGAPMTVAEHYAINFPDEDEARAQYRIAREALSLPRTGIPPMTFRRSLDAQSSEQELVDLLAG